MVYTLNNLPFKKKLHSHGWFILINALIAIAISTRYFVFLPEFPSELITVIFIIVGVISQMSLLSFIIGFVAIPFLLLPIKARRISQSTIASIGIALLFIDTIVFAQYRFHINLVVVNMFLSGQVINFPLITWLMVIAGMSLLVICQWLFVRWLEGDPILVRLRLGRKFALLVFFALLATNGIHIWAAAYAYQPVTIVKRYLPLFLPATSTTMMSKYGWIDEEALKNQKAMQIKRKSDLHYPLFPLKTESVENPVNIMWLVIDSWRTDTFNAEVTPNLWAIVEKNNGVILNDHMSTGNATRTGIFGLFYSLPGTYWHGFLANQRAPLFIDRLQELNYDLGIFSSAKLNSPEFDQTVFVNVPDLRKNSTGNSPSERDHNLTKDWLAWDESRDRAKSAFSFLFYDSPHGYDFPDNYPKKFVPYLKTLNYLELNNETDPTALFNRYKTSVNFVDTQIKRVLDKLKESGDLDNTVVIITGDHAQELNDNKLNFWGHNSNFTDAQVHVPFAIFGPGVNEQSIQPLAGNMTSHQDVVPTLMKNHLGVQNDVADYSTGDDLLAKPIKREWLIASSYSGYAIVTDSSILEVKAGGNYQLFDKTNRDLKGQALNYKQLEQALKMMSKFNK
jgi:membrane-anchored protein YejM (alkaline phosphatase superfamily)